MAPMLLVLGVVRRSWSQATLKAFRASKKMVKAQDWLPRCSFPPARTGQCTTSPPPPTAPLAHGKQGLAQGRHPGKTLALLLRAAPCTVPKVHLKGLASLWGSSLALGPTRWNSQSNSLLENPRSGGSVGGTLHPRGANTFPKVSPALAGPATCPTGPSESCSPPGGRVPVYFQPWKKAMAQLSASSQEHAADLGLAVGSCSEYPKPCGLERVSSQRSSQGGLCLDAAIWEEIP